jgi:hypothetical protein
MIRFFVAREVPGRRLETIAERAMRWVTRENIKVDRVACPWLITRFVDPDALFLFVPEGELLATAEREHATPFDATRLPDVRLNHRGVRCTFESILEDFNLTDRALHRLGEIVRAADVKGQEHICPEGLGLRAIAEGFAALPISDEERLRLEFPMYDALYAYAQRSSL